MGAREQAPVVSQSKAVAHVASLPGDGDGSGGGDDRSPVCSQPLTDGRLITEPVGRRRSDSIGRARRRLPVPNRIACHRMTTGRQECKQAPSCFG